MSTRRKRNIAAAVIIMQSMKKKKSRKYWVKNWLAERDRFSHMPLLKELATNNPEDFRNYLRMTEDAFNLLLHKVEQKLTKTDTNMRKAIPTKERLIATLNWLATGRTFEELKFSTAISAQTLGRIVPETCKIIYDELKGEYMKFPASKEDWLTISRDFHAKWNFPNCGGAFDGKHIRIKRPPNSGAFYYNYKGFYSIVLLALVNANYEFVLIDVGTNGRVSDGGVIEKTAFYEKLKNNELNIPDPEDNVKNLNFTFVGDEAFALHANLLKPYPQKNLSRKERIFNYRLSRARNVSENAFGILVSTFRIFHSCINISLEHVDYAVMAACVLHNFLRRQSPKSYMPTKMIDSEDIIEGTINEGEWRATQTSTANLQITSQKNSVCSAKASREKYMEYFNSPEGSVPWQNQMVGLPH